MRVLSAAGKFELGMRPAALLLAIALGLLIVAAACGGSSTILPTPGPNGETVIRIDMGDNFFFPNAITIRANQKYILALHNKGKEAHNLRIAGPDGQFDTEDDIVLDDIKGGKRDTLALDLNVPGTFEFRSDSQAVEMTGALTVWVMPTIPPPTPSPEPIPTTEEPAISTVVPTTEEPAMSTVPPASP